MAALQLERRLHEAQDRRQLVVAEFFEHADAVARDRPVIRLRNAAGLGRRLDDYLAAIFLAAFARQQSARLEAIDKRGYRGWRQPDRRGDGAGRLRAAMQEPKAA